MLIVGSGRRMVARCTTTAEGGHPPSEDSEAF
jgi:hypothetical protein